MDKAKQKRTTLRSLTTKLISKVETKIFEDEIEQGELEELLEQLQLKQTELNVIDLEIQNEITKIDEIEEEIIKCDEYSVNLVVCKCKIKRVIENCKTKLLSTVSSEKSSELDSSALRNKRVLEQPSVKLPRLIIEKFNGNPSDWQRFWDQFESTIHKNEDISNIDKFNYLKSYLIGIAADAVKGFSLTNSNYQAAIDTLKERFGKKNLLTKVY